MLLKVEAVLIGNLKLKANSACIHFHSVFRHLKSIKYWDQSRRARTTHLHKNLNPNSFGSDNMAGGVSFNSSDVVCVVFRRPEPRAFKREPYKAVYNVQGI